MGLSVSEAAATGDVRATLEAMRDTLAAQLDLADASVAAQVSGQLRQVLKDLAALPAAQGGSKVDELRERRDSRRRAATAPVAVAAKGGRKRG